MDLNEIVKDAAQIGIAGHIRPDGDCIGSCMGLYLYLKKICPRAQVRVYLERPASIFNCISGLDLICVTGDGYDSSADQTVHDVFFVLDSVPERIGAAVEYYERAHRTVNIDHHISNKGCSDDNFIDPLTGSTSELICRLMDMDLLDEDIAKALYIGIIHDTGVLQYSNTSPGTLRTVARLLEFGFDFSRLIEETFYEKTYLQTQIMGRALLESFRFLDGRCIVSSIDRKMLRFYEAGPEDMEGIVNQLRAVKGVKCAVFMYETGIMEHKVSMRSDGSVDVSKIAVHFGGGGHVRAAGCTMNGTSHDVINNLSRQIEEQIGAGTTENSGE